MGKPFKGEFHLAGGVVLPFTVTEESIIQSRDPVVKSFAAAGTRIGFRSGAVEMLRASLERNREKPLRVFEDDTIWIVPTGTVMAVRLTDPDIPKGERRFGFSLDLEEPHAKNDPGG